VVGGEFVAVAGRAVGIDGMEVGVAVSGGFVGGKTVTVSINGLAVGGEVDVDVQAVMKTTARMSMMI